MDAPPKRGLSELPALSDTPGTVLPALFRMDCLLPAAVKRHPILLVTSGENRNVSWWPERVLLSELTPPLLSEISLLHVAGPPGKPGHHCLTPLENLEEL